MMLDDEALDARLDEALRQTFPASDPVAVQVDRRGAVEPNPEEPR